MFVMSVSFVMVDLRLMSYHMNIVTGSEHRHETCVLPALAGLGSASRFNLPARADVIRKRSHHAACKS